MKVTNNMNVIFNAINSEKLTVFIFQNAPDVFVEFDISGAVEYFFVVFSMKSKMVKDLTVTSHS